MRKVSVGLVLCVLFVCASRLLGLVRKVSVRLALYVLFGGEDHMLRVGRVRAFRKTIVLQSRTDRGKC